jgi:hypothetical protein
MWLGLCSLILLTAAPGGRESRFFEDVTLRPGQGKFTVQVSSPKETGSTMGLKLPIVVSVFKGPRGHRHLLASKRVGTNDARRVRSSYHVYRRGSVGLLTTVGLEDGGYHTSVFAFDRKTHRPKEVFSAKGYLDVHRLAQGVAVESDFSKSVGYKPRKDGRSEVAVNRLLTFDPSRETFIRGKWHEAVINPPASCRLRGHAGGHTFEVRMSKRNFRLAGRRVKFDRSGCPIIDGMETIGSYGPSPDQQAESARSGHRDLFLTELTLFDVRIDGKAVPVPSALWRPCMDPNFPADAKLSKDGKKLTITMCGSDGAGAYEARFTYSSGKWRRTVRGLD